MGNTWIYIFKKETMLIFCFRLKPLDIEVMKHLGSRVNLIPVIAKADTLTPNDLAKFKVNVSEQKYIKKNNKYNIY